MAQDSKEELNPYKASQPVGESSDSRRIQRSSISAGWYFYFGIRVACVIAIWIFYFLIRSGAVSPQVARSLLGVSAIGGCGLLLLTPVIAYICLVQGFYKDRRYFVLLLVEMVLATAQFFSLSAFGQIA